MKLRRTKQNVPIFGPPYIDSALPRLSASWLHKCRPNTTGRACKKCVTYA